MSLSAADQAYAFAKQAILTRRYPPNDIITEGDVAAAAGVSRTPVREALLRLHGEGLVRLLPRRGALVLAVTPVEAANVMELRRLLELHAVRAALRKPDERLSGRLAAELENMRDAIESRDIPAYVAADRAFHTAIVAATGNAILVEFYNGLRDRQLRMGANLFSPEGTPDVSRPKATLADHSAILDAVTSGSVDAAEAVITAHLDHAEQTFQLE